MFERILCALLSLALLFAAIDNTMQDIRDNVRIINSIDEYRLVEVRTDSIGVVAEYYDGAITGYHLYFNGGAAYLSDGLFSADKKRMNYFFRKKSLDKEETENHYFFYHPNLLDFYYVPEMNIPFAKRRFTNRIIRKILFLGLVFSFCLVLNYIAYKVNERKKTRTELATKK